MYEFSIDARSKADLYRDLLAALDLELHIVPRSKIRPSDLEDVF